VNHARDDQPDLIGGDAAEDRKQSKKPQAEHDDFSSTKNVGQPASGDHERADREHVAADDPL